MKKTIIAYVSVHHKNTKKVIDYLKERLPIDAIDVTEKQTTDLSEYELVVFASGIYFGDLHRLLLDYIESTDLSGKKTAVFYTCGLRFRNFAKHVGKLLEKKGSEYLGSCYCRGYDTYGCLARIGGIAKKHPNEKDCEKILERIKKQME